MKELSRSQLQSILDNYSVGKIIESWTLASTSIDGEKGINLSRCIAETNQGIYFIVFAPNDDIHGLWWSSDPQNFAAILSKALKLINSKILLTNQNTNTFHKFDLRISVFTL